MGTRNMKKHITPQVKSAVPWTVNSETVAIGPKFVPANPGVGPANFYNLEFPSGASSASGCDVPNCWLEPPFHTRWCPG